MDAKKAMPSNKASQKMQARQFRVTEKPHYINGALRDVGWIGQLPEGVTPGKYLIEVDESGNPVSAKEADPLDGAGTKDGAGAKEKAK